VDLIDSRGGYKTATAIGLPYPSKSTLTLKYTQPLVTQFKSIKKELGIRKTTAVDTTYLPPNKGSEIANARREQSRS
jgi:hypothetical protein